MSRTTTPHPAELILRPKEPSIIALAALFVFDHREAESENARNGIPLDAKTLGTKVHKKWTEECRKALTDGDLKGQFQVGQVSTGVREAPYSAAKRFDLRLFNGTKEYVFEVQATGSGPHKQSQKRAQDLYVEEVASGRVERYTVTARDTEGQPTLIHDSRGSRKRDLSSHLITELSKLSQQRKDR